MAHSNACGIRAADHPVRRDRGHSPVTHQRAESGASTGNSRPRRESRDSDAVRHPAKHRAGFAACHSFDVVAGRERPASRSRSGSLTRTRASTKPPTSETRIEAEPARRAASSWRRAGPAWRGGVATGRRGHHGTQSQQAGQSRGNKLSALQDSVIGAQSVRSRSRGFCVQTKRVTRGDGCRA